MEYKKGTKGFCGECDDLIFVFSKDVVTGTPVLESIFEQDQGQAPFKNGDRTVCKKCQAHWGYPFGGALINVTKPLRFVEGDIT